LFGALAFLGTRKTAARSNRGDEMMTLEKTPEKRNLQNG